VKKKTLCKLAFDLKTEITLTNTTLKKLINVIKQQHFTEQQDNIQAIKGAVVMNSTRRRVEKTK